LFNSSGQRTYNLKSKTIVSTKSSSVLLLKTGYYARTIIRTSSKSTLMKRKKLSAKTTISTQSNSRIRFHTIELYTYYTQLAGMYIGYDKYMKALRSHTEVSTKSTSYINVATALHAKTTIKTSSTAKMRTKSFTHDPKWYSKSEPLFIYDRAENLQLVLSDDGIPYREGWLTEQLNGQVSLEFEVLANNPMVSKIENEGRVITRDIDGNFAEFIIREIEDIDDAGGTFKYVYAEGGEYELINEVLTGYTHSGVTIGTALNAILAGTRWEVGYVDDLGVKSVDLRYMTVKQAVYELLNAFKGEVRYRVKVAGNRVVKRYIDVFEQRGEDTGKRFEIGRDIISSNRTLNSEEIRTALYGFGAAGDDDGPRLTFADVEWRKEWGDPVDKPLGLEWVGDEEAAANWGYKDNRHKFGIYSGQEEDPAELLLNTWEALQEQKNLNETYDFDVVQLSEILDMEHDKVRLGDRAYAINRRISPEIVVKHSIVEYRHNLNDRKLSEVTLGDFRNVHDLAKSIKDVEKVVEDKQGSWEKKLGRNELEDEINETLEEAQRRIDQARNELQNAMDDIERTKIDLDDAERAIQDTIDNPQNYVGNFDGTIAADSIILRDEVIAVNARFIGEIQGSALTVLNAAIEKANIIDANIQDARITGTLDGVDGNFIGTVTAENIQGRQIYGVTFDTGFSGGYRINMEEQRLRFYQDNNVKMTIGFRDGDDNPLYEPFIRMGKGKSDGTSVFYVSKHENDVTLSYSADRNLGTANYSEFVMNHSGSVRLSAAGSFLYLNSDYKIKANTTFEAPEINQTSTVKAKDNIRKYEGDALGIVMDTDVFNYHFIKDLKKGIYDNEQVGFLAESSPMLKMDDSISLNRAVAYNWAATQQQQRLIDRLTKRVDDLELMMEVI